ncbi:D-xylose-proton symporter [Botrimarina colliarenosi]|uniref:D-xylose-proton symporter n=1 Tax=Botrimarina colliarenosi TaxID=2528001 RepID=A0A5C6AJF0_9BACT|nr:sugar porter family MFS transporter [Botrimarina colliarenosi]TWT99530.1 D-xylose-proton symporter [Botrimarina colliarenosi]
MRQSGKLFQSALVASLGGFLFGFDTAVISGAEQTIQSLWSLSDTLHGLAMSAALWGTVLGALAGSVPTDRWGRKPTLFWIGVLYFVSAVWSAFAGDVGSFMAARFIGGVGVGVSTVAAPLYIAEISPPGLRGRLTGMFQFNIVFGILIAFVSNYFMKQIGDDSWRWMLGVEAIPALLYTVLTATIPESPRWLIGFRADREGALTGLARLNPGATAAETAALVDEIEAAAVAEESVTGGSRFAGTLTKPLLLAFLVAFFNQLSGINAILYFAPRIFEMAGLGDRAALLQSVGIGLTNLVFTFVGLALIDRLGRRTLLLIGSFGYILSLGLCSWAFFNDVGSIVPACLFAFIASHAVGQGAVIWVFISEIFPNEHRALGNSVGSGTHWVFAALLTAFFPRLVTAFAPGTVFAFFCGMMVLQLIWVLTMVPETKGVSLEEIQRRLGLV